LEHRPHIAPKRIFGFPIDPENQTSIIAHHSLSKRHVGPERTCAFAACSKRRLQTKIDYDAVGTSVRFLTAQASLTDVLAPIAEHKMNQIDSLLPWR